MLDISKYVKCSPSSAHRWMVCPGAAIFAALPRDRTSSIYAARGTAAHTLLEDCLEDGVGGGRYPDEMLGETVEVDGFDITYNQEDIDAVETALNEIELMEIGANHTEVEQPFELPGRIPIRGRLDVAIIANYKITVIDYKHGSGKTVSAIGNWQLFIYLLGMIDRYGERESYETVIIQPRAPYGDRVSRETLSSVEVNAKKEDLDFALGRVEAAARRLLDGSEVPDGTWVTGGHCQWCPGAGVCPGYANKYLTAAMLQGKEYSNDKLIEAVICSEKDIKRMMAETKKNVTKRMTKGEKINGLKLVATTSKRAWREDLSLEEMFELSAMGLAGSKLVTLGDAKKLTDEDLSKYIKEPEKNGYKVVPRSAKGHEVVPIEELFDVE